VVIGRTTSSAGRPPSRASAAVSKERRRSCPRRFHLIGQQQTVEGERRVPLPPPLPLVRCCRLFVYHSTSAQTGATRASSSKMYGLSTWICTSESASAAASLPQLSPEISGHSAGRALFGVEPSNSAVAQLSKKNPFMG